MVRKIVFYVMHPQKIPEMLFSHFKFSFLSDAVYIKLRFYLEFGYFLNLKNPKTFNEKIQWIKLYDRRPEYISLADKYEVKQIVKDLIGEEYVIPTLGMWKNFSDIDFSELPNQFVLKSTHDSGGIEVVLNKKTMDLNAMKKHINKSMRRNYYWYGREWCYKDIKPRILAEKYIGNKEFTTPDDYKIFCFNGEPKIIQVDFDRFTNHRRNLYTTKWQFIPAQIKYPNDPDHVIERPSKLSEMLDIAKKLSKGYIHVRVDLYYIEEKVYFGELTFYHGSGTEHFTPTDFCETMGSWMEIPIDL